MMHLGSGTICACASHPRFLDLPCRVYIVYLALPAPLSPLFDVGHGIARRIPFGGRSDLYDAAPSASLSRIQGPNDYSR
jgi:hypothetical protein